MSEHLVQRSIPIAVVALVVALAALGYGGYRYYTLSQHNEVLLRNVSELEELLVETQNNLSLAQEDNENLSEALRAEQERLRRLGEEVEEITDTVGTLEKLSRLDPELLQKYSRVFFLNEHYMPPRLTDIPPEYLYFEDQPQEIHREVWPFLEDLLEEAEDDGVTLYVRSAFRSFGTQSALKDRYLVTYGTGANQFSADQGYSEHQLGTTVDFTTTGLNGELTGFETTEAYEWLLDNAHTYGFVLSYPEGNQFYQFEPWHWRFVGEELARDLERRGEHFYDLDQREIDEYLVEIFD